MENAARHILVAEDTAVLALMLRRTLERAGFTVTITKNGREAWDKAQAIGFDAIVTDQQMPEMSGTELCEQLRQLQGYAHTPVIMITAKAYELNLSRVREELNISAIFAKPFSPAKVQQVLEKCVNVSS
jgi:CheY-like chemotaxis protein